MILKEKHKSKKALEKSKCHLAEYGKQQATLSISHAQKRARSCFAMARKSAMKWNSFARTTSRKRVQGETLLLVVSLAATLGLHGPRRGDILAKRCSLL